MGNSRLTLSGFFGFLGMEHEKLQHTLAEWLRSVVTGAPETVGTEVVKQLTSPSLSHS
jgi:hypothetical protein